MVAAADILQFQCPPVTFNLTEQVQRHHACFVFPIQTGGGVAVISFKDRLEGGRGRVPSLVPEEGKSVCFCYWWEF